MSISFCDRRPNDATEDRHRIVVRFYFIRFTYYKYNGRNVLGGARGKDKKAQPNEDDARTADMTAGWRMGSIE